ncbi:hypothetical protein ES707_03028 [subsurface metagenome]|jgi:hypothetical protein
MPVYCSRIARRVRLAENVNGIAGLEVTSAESHIGVEREIGDRERADISTSSGELVANGIQVAELPLST